MDTPCFLICPEPAAEGATPLYNNIDEAGGSLADSGTDLRFADDCTIPPETETDGLPAVISLNVRVRCMRGGEYVAFRIVPRSSIGKTPLELANSEGIIDSGYTGPLRVAIRNHKSSAYCVARGHALFQMVLPDLAPATVLVVQADHPAFAPGASKRGIGGFGSTGVQGTCK
jgi:dUTPase